MYCIECGHQNTDTAKFCRNCGQEILPYQAEFIEDLKSTTASPVQISSDETSSTLTSKAPLARNSKTDDFFAQDFTTGPEGEKVSKVDPRFSGVLSGKFRKFWQSLWLTLLITISFSLSFVMSARQGIISYDFYTISGLVVDTILPTFAALIIAFVVRRLVPKFRSVPTYDLVIRTLWVVIILGGIGLWGVM